MAQQRYYPYGQVRWSDGTLATDYTYTGQGNEAGLGLMDYNARFYDPYLNRFISADTIVPNPLSPQLLNRYSYAGNNPVLYNDPDGHCGPLCIVGLVAAGVALLSLTSDVAPPPDSQVAHSRAGNQRVGETALWVAGLCGVGILATPGVSGPVTAKTMTELAAVSACADGDCTNEVNGAAQAAQNVWEMNPLQRGVEIEDMLGRSSHLSQNFPVIDRFESGVATSIKSMDLGAASYQNISTLTSKVTGYVNTLANWQGADWGGAVVRTSQITGRELLLAIPPGATEAQMSALQGLQQWATTVGVTLNITVVP